MLVDIMAKAHTADFGNLVEQRDDLCLKGFPSPQKCQLLMDLAINVDLIFEINQTANGL